MKRKIFISLVIILALSVFMATGAFAAESEVEGSLGDNVTWTLTSDGVLTVSGNGAMADYELKYSFGSFVGCTSPIWSHAASVKSIVIEDGVTGIGNAAFYGCKVKSVDIADSVSLISAYAFGNCDELESIVIPDSVTNIYSKAFDGCDALKQVKLSKNWNKMGPYGYDGSYNANFGAPLYDSPFSNCPSITEIEVPEGANKVVACAFKGLVNLQKIILPSSISEIPAEMACNCPALEEVNLPANLTKIGTAAFSECVSLKEIILPSKLLEICERAFYECDSLTSVIIPDSVEAIDAEAFANCDELSYVSISQKWNTLRSSDASLGKSPFAACPKLTSIELPDGITYLPDGAFYYASNLVNVTLPNSLTIIGMSAFYMCDKLEEIVFPDALVMIKDNAFNGCASLKDFELPGKLEQIGIAAFSGCNNIEKLSIPDSVSSIGTSAFSNCEKLSYVKVPANWSMVIPLSGVSTANTSSPFVSCPNLEEIVLPDGMELIPQYAFQNMSNMQKVSFPQSLKKIGASAFRNSALKEVTIPAGVTLGDSPVSGGAVFSNCKNLEKVIIEDSETYKFLPPACFSECTALKNIEIPKCTTIIGSSAFAGCVNLENVVLSENLISIYDYVFKNCDSLSSVVIPDTVTNIGDYAFEDCDKLESVLMGNNVTSITKGAFKSCDKLKTVVLSEALTAISSGCFSDCASLEELVLPRGITEIAPSAFFDSYNLEKVVCYSAIESIGSRAFPYADRTVFYGEAGSYMETWAQENGFKFVVNTTPATEITLDEVSLELDKDAASVIKASVQPLGSAGEISYSSDKPEVVSVDDKGNITALKNGTATITVSCGNLSASCIVEVIGEHVHEYSSVITVPTCTEDGYTTYTCECGDSYVGDTVTAAGHNWDDGKVTREPTEKEEGEMTFSCTVCEETMVEGIPALEHAHKYSSVVTEPTCTEEGYTTHTCQCGDSYIDSTVAAVGHKWDDGAVTKEPTTSEEGEKTFTCTVCSETKTEKIDKLPDEPKPDEPKPEEPIVNPFTDVNEKDFFFEPVMWAVSNNVTSGLSATSFGPSKGCTRAQVVTFLWRAAGEPAPQSSENPFTDVKEGQYYYDAVLWAVENGITTGLSATAFGPNADCNRGQIVTFLWRAMGKPAPTSNNNPFADVPESQYYYDAVLWAVENGITTGLSATSFGPNATCTRGQIVTFLYRAYQ